MSRTVQLDLSQEEADLLLALFTLGTEVMQGKTDDFMLAARGVATIHHAHFKPLEAKMRQLMQANDPAAFKKAFGKDEV